MERPPIKQFSLDRPRNRSRLRIAGGLRKKRINCRAANAADPLLESAALSRLP